MAERSPPAAYELSTAGMPPTRASSRTTRPSKSFASRVFSSSKKSEEMRFTELPHDSETDSKKLLRADGAGGESPPLDSASPGCAVDSEAATAATTFATTSAATKAAGVDPSAGFDDGKAVTAVSLLAATASKRETYTSIWAMSDGSGAHGIVAPGTLEGESSPASRSSVAIGSSSLEAGMPACAADDMRDDATTSDTGFSDTCCFALEESEGRLLEQEEEEEEEDLEDEVSFILGGLPLDGDACGAAGPGVGPLSNLPEDFVVLGDTTGLTTSPTTVQSDLGDVTGDAASAASSGLLEAHPIPQASKVVCPMWRCARRCRCAPIDAAMQGRPSAFAEVDPVREVL